LAELPRGPNTHRGVRRTENAEAGLSMRKGRVRGSDEPPLTRLPPRAWPIGSVGYSGMGGEGQGGWPCRGCWICGHGWPADGEGKDSGRRVLSRAPGAAGIGACHWRLSGTPVVADLHEAIPSVRRESERRLAVDDDREASAEPDDFAPA